MSALTEPWIPRGVIGRFRAGAAPGSAATTTETALYTGIGTATIVVGRLYRITSKGRVTPSTTSATGRAAFRVRDGSGTGGNLLATMSLDQSTTAAIDFLVVSDFLIGGTDITAGPLGFSITAEAAAGTLTGQWSAGSLSSNTWLNVEDCGLA